MAPASSGKTPGKKKAQARGAADSVRPSLLFERGLGFPARAVAGVDEVGRGCLAGPVVAGAVILSPDWEERVPEWALEVRDSKLLSPEERERLAPLIRSQVLAWGLGQASVQEIDRINIYHASHLAMVRALDQALKAPAGSGRSPLSRADIGVLVDGNRVPSQWSGLSARAVVKGDLKCLSIACASVLAKVDRDAQLKQLAVEHPGYGFEVHKGYFTPAHKEALRRLGPCAEHRRSFAPVAEQLEQPRLL